MALFSSPAHAGTNTPFGGGNCKGSLKGHTASDNMGARERLTISAECSKDQHNLLQIKTEFTYFAVQGNSKHYFVSAAKGNNVAYGAEGAHSMLVRADAPTKYAEYCASAVVTYIGLSGSGNTVTMTQESGLVCWN
ncbi:hypothetical protein FB384_000045 [Prauserella sediminis]|uniref:Uncharacterized protein n=1 Tax=Prauserella sediminis TaxID=577680 RepID=A0A839XEG2_9PSEU|nr:hypothetical protein [Prauserella sediminis]MBB3661141.1 hypothetical protein [Prauserella sediminis]